MSTFMQNFTAARIAREDANLGDREKKVAKLRIVKIVQFLLQILADGKKAIVETIDSTDAVMALVRLGGLAEHEETIKRFFTSRPDLFWVYSVGELFKQFTEQKREDLKDFIAGVYYNRVINFDGKACDFHWAVKGIFEVFLALKADNHNTKALADDILDQQSELLQDRDCSGALGLLLAVSRTSEYISKPPNNVIAVADKDKVVGESGNSVSRQALPAGPADVRVLWSALQRA